jgi:PKD repeat protein
MMQNQSAPPLAGPSGFGLSLTLAARPDTLPRDGSSQSTILVTFRDGSSNEPLSGRRLVLSTSAGTLSSSEVQTDSAGNAAFTFTAPSIDTPASAASVRVLPVGEDAANVVPKFVQIALLGPDVPTAAFTFNPSSPSVGADVTFDASTSSLAGSACGATCSYTWDFGDGSSGTGMLVQHIYTSAGVRNVTLTVGAPGGTSNTATRSFTLGAPTAPVAAFTVTPANPVATQQAIFNASTSTVGSGATIAQYVWDFGDSTTTTTTVPITPKTYAAAGTYIATLTVTDSLGRTATVTQTVTVN